MKNLIAILLIVCSIQLTAQEKQLPDILKLYKEYRLDCEKLVTIEKEVSGTIRFDVVEHKDLTFRIIPKDTIWNKCDCQDYFVNNEPHEFRTGYISSSLVGDGISWGHEEWGSIVVKLDTLYCIPVTKTIKCIMKNRNKNFYDFKIWLHEKGY